MSNSDKPSKPYMSNCDFKVKNELMVTITLYEYRSLVQYKASYDGKLNEARERASKAESDFNELKNKYEKLKTAYDGLRTQNDEEEW